MYLRQHLRHIAQDETGGAYTLSYVLVVPFLMLFMCMIVETTLMLSAKIGTQYAAFAGARVATVWASAVSWDEAQSRTEEAAQQAFLPFASGAMSRANGQEAENFGRYYESYSEYVEDPASEAYLRKKSQNASNSLTVTIEGPPSQWDDDLTVIVRYECPFRIPGIARLFGEQGDNGGYYFPLTSEVTLQNEGPQNEQQDMGIGYGKFN